MYSSSYGSNNHSFLATHITSPTDFSHENVLHNTGREDTIYTGWVGREGAALVGQGGRVLHWLGGEGGCSTGWAGREGAALVGQGGRVLHWLGREGGCYTG